MNILFEMTNPRKFSEKIALHSQKLAQETAAFEQIMREVGSAVVHNDPSSSAATIDHQTCLSRNMSSQQHQQQQQQQRHQRHRSMSHTLADNGYDVNLTSPGLFSGHVTGYSAMSNGINNTISGPGDPRYSMVGPQRSGRSAGKHRRETSPYSSQLLSPPSMHLSSPDSSTATTIGWRRTASDSALHRSVQMCDTASAISSLSPAFAPCSTAAATQQECDAAHAAMLHASAVYPGASYLVQNRVHQAAAGVGVNSNAVDYHQQDPNLRHGSSPDSCADGVAGDSTIPTVVQNWSFSPPIPPPSHHHQNPISPGSPIPLQHQQNPGSPVPLRHYQNPISPGSPVSLPPHHQHTVSSGSHSPSTPNTGESLSPFSVHYNTHVVNDALTPGSLPDLTEIGAGFPPPITAPIPVTGCANGGASGAYSNSPLIDTDSIGTSSPPALSSALYSSQASSASNTNHLSVPHYVYRPGVQQNWDVLSGDQTHRQCQLSLCSSPVFDQRGFRSGSPHGVPSSRSPSPVLTSPQTAPAAETCSSPASQQLLHEQLQLQRQFELCSMQGIYDGSQNCNTNHRVSGVISATDAKSSVSSSIPKIIFSDFSTSECAGTTRSACPEMSGGARTAESVIACGEDPFRDTDLGELDLDGLCMLNSCEPELVDPISEDCFRVESMTP